MNAAPHSEGIGRPAKVSKENIAGLITALELFTDTDHEAVQATWRKKCRYIVDALQGIDHVRAEMSDAMLAMVSTPSVVLMLTTGRICRQPTSTWP